MGREALQPDLSIVCPTNFSLSIIASDKLKFVGQQKSRPDCALPFTTRPQPTVISRRPIPRCFWLNNDSRDYAACTCKAMSLRPQPAHRLPHPADRQSSHRVWRRREFPRLRSAYRGDDPKRFDFDTRSRSKLANCHSNRANYRCYSPANCRNSLLNRRSVNRSRAVSLYPARKWKRTPPPIFRSKQKLRISFSLSDLRAWEGQ